MNISINSKRLNLVRLSNRHVTKEYLSWINDPDVNMYMETKGHYTLNQLKSYVQEKFENETYFWAIHRKDNGSHIGNIKIDPINLEANSGEYGILIGDKLSWGMGFGKEATLRVIKYCFEEIKLSKITLGVIEDNLKATTLYNKIGFVVYETIQDAGFYNGKLSKALRMSLNVEKFLS